MLFESMRESAREAIVECLENGYEGYGADFHNEVFNTNPLYLDNDRAKLDLEEMGAFDAIEYVKNYEKDNFGEVYTDFSNPMQVGNILWYIVGEEELASMFKDCSEWDEWWNEEIGETECKVLIAWLVDHERI